MVSKNCLMGRSPASEKYFPARKKRNESALGGERTARRKTGIRLASVHFKLSGKRECCPDLTETWFLPNGREGITGLLVGLRQAAGEYPPERKMVSGEIVRF
ncbi:hypothetical protein NAI82_03610 [Oxalobacter sp. JAC-2022]|uniref:hypothetical protein n=1 Tax=Oxalobacter aliiformigenes TaxID=2946593 RepID=UPI0022B01553|nr:hypothetical protein [Oxalobacter aliiformigenes]MCZ4064520.1 hypothetical protein [Oxalobacter aliiformigenes]